ncbi:MAG: hypothetical protein EOP04_30000, partial [Proteobacteria bacterium]
MIRLLHLFTVISVLGLSPLYGQAAPYCAQVFGGNAPAVPAYSETISEHLEILKRNLNQLRKALKDNKHKAHRLEVLSELETDPRESAYVLQGAYRLLLAHPNSAEIFTPSDIQSLEKGLKAMKVLEKTLGGYQVQADLYVTAKKMKLPE